jgi:hypothetical protein
MYCERVNLFPLSPACPEKAEYRVVVTRHSPYGPSQTEARVCRKCAMVAQEIFQVPWYCIHVEKEEK